MRMVSRTIRPYTVYVGIRCVLLDRGSYAVPVYLLICHLFGLNNPLVTVYSLVYYPLPPCELNLASVSVLLLICYPAPQPSGVLAEPLMFLSWASLLQVA